MTTTILITLAYGGRGAIIIKIMSEFIVCFCCKRGAMKKFAVQKHLCPVALRVTAAI
jgi:hypothetical protein